VNVGINRTLPDVGLCRVMLKASNPVEFPTLPLRLVLKNKRV